MPARRAPSQLPSYGKTVARGARNMPTLPGLADMPARDRAYHDLRYRILTGRLAAGTTLLETELAGLLSLSRTPVREAVIKLAEEGLVEVRPRHGVTVKALTLKDIADILDIFSALEVRAAELVARRGLSAEDAAELGRQLDDMEALTAAGEIARWTDIDNEFHSYIVALCGNKRLQDALAGYWNQQFRSRAMIVPLRPLPTISDREHREILAALKSGDPIKARHAYQNHRDRTDAAQLEMLRGLLGRNGIA